MYLVRLGTWPTYREEAVGYMKWGVAILFSLVVLLAVQKFLLAHLNVFFIILALIVAGIVVWAFIPGENNTPEKKPGAH